MVPTLWTEQRWTMGWVGGASFLKGCASAKSWPVSCLFQTSEKNRFEMALRSWCRVRPPGGAYTCVGSRFRRGNSKGVGEMAQQGRALTLAESLSVNSKPPHLVV